MKERYIPVRQQLWQEPVFSPKEGEPFAPTRHQVDRWRAQASNFPATLDELPYGRRDWVDVVATRAFQAGRASAADLLEQRQAAPVPVPVSERLPGAGDCDGDGRCWWGFEETDDYEASWTLRKMIGLPFDDTHWLPATALPLPAEEVQP